MKTILVTGSAGFIGKNLTQCLTRLPDVTVRGFDLHDDNRTLPGLLAAADAVFHLAGVNRPDREEDFLAGNALLTARIVDRLIHRKTRPLLVLSSSIQAELDNPYGRSKKRAEEELERYGDAGGDAVIFRLPNVFGKWSRPNYNSAVATFCHNMARGLAISVSDPHRMLDLVYIDDVVRAFADLLNTPSRPGARVCSVEPVTRISLQELVNEIRAMHDVRTALRIPDLADRFRKTLFATYLSFLPPEELAYPLTQRTDDRGVLAEMLRSEHFGQVFVSRTKPGIVRGNHFHDTKFEKFLVIEGEAVIRFRAVEGDAVYSYRVCGDELRVVDIPPGYTHSLENTGAGELVTLFWAGEPFDPNAPDTHSLTVLRESANNRNES